jgi:hypothetical protein
LHDFVDFKPQPQAASAGNPAWGRNHSISFRAAS